MERSRCPAATTRPGYHDHGPDGGRRPPSTPRAPTGASTPRPARPVPSSEKLNVFGGVSQGDARPLAGRAHVCRSQRALHAAEYLRRRPAAATGPRHDVRSGHPRQDRRHGLLPGGTLPDESRRRHPVRQRRERRGQRRIFPECRQRAAPRNLEPTPPVPHGEHSTSRAGTACSTRPSGRRLSRAARTTRPPTGTATSRFSPAIVFRDCLAVLFRVRADWASGPYAIGVTVLAASSQYARGNENNADPGGRVPGYALVTLDASWQLAPEWQAFARIDNLLNRTYQNFGTPSSTGRRRLLRALAVLGAGDRRDRIHYRCPKARRARALRHAGGIRYASPRARRRWQDGTSRCRRSPGGPPCRPLRPRRCARVRGARRWTRLPRPHPGRRYRLARGDQARQPPRPTDGGALARSCHGHRQ